MSEDNFIENTMDKSYLEYIKPVIDTTSFFYRVYDNCSQDDRVIINSKIDKIVKEPKNLNNILNIDPICGNIVHVPMASSIYIEHENNELKLNVSDLNANTNMKFDDSSIKVYSVKSYKNTIYQDITIQTNNTLIIVQIYKFKLQIENITHGAFIIYQNDTQGSNQNNMIFYTKNNPNLIISHLTDTTDITDIKKKDKLKILYRMPCLAASV